METRERSDHRPLRRARSCKRVSAANSSHCGEQGGHEFGLDDSP
jgi:hypothetical protein